MSLSDLIPPQDKILAAALVVLAAFCAGVGIGWTGNGWRLGKTISDMHTAAANAHAEDVQTARVREQALEALFTAEQAKRHEEEQQHAKTVDYWRGRVRSGAERLSIAVAGEQRECSAAADPAAAGKPGQPARADILPEAADTVLRIAADDAAGVQDYNELLRLYNAARATCNRGVTR